ncbi:hypothetical protein ACEPAH_2593 [Sanghuangporus vaninii]
MTMSVLPALCDDQHNTLLHHEQPPQADCVSSSRSLLSDEKCSSSLNTLHGIRKLAFIKDNLGKKAIPMSQTARYVRLLVFAIVEMLWFGFALFATHHLFAIHSGGSSLSLIGISVTRDALIKSSLSSMAILVQLIALLPVADITIEFCSSEWVHVLTQENGRLTHRTDRVSILTTTLKDRVAHVFDRRSSMRYRISSIVAFLALALQTIAPGALTISSDAQRTDANLTIGALAAGKTDETEPPLSFESDDNQLASFDLGSTTVLARNLLVESARYEYNAWLGNSSVNYNINSSNLLFGMPSRELFGMGINLDYQSDAVQFQFECQWLAPTYLNGDLLHSNWTFGGDMEGCLDYNAIPILARPNLAAGIWPLMITNGTGATNGSLAWLFIGTGTEEDAHADQMPLDISSIPPTQRTYNASHWWDFVNYTGATDADLQLQSVMSTDASVLFCDPHMQIVGIHATLLESQVFANLIEEPSVGNIDRGEASRMFGRCLNGMPWDDMKYQTPGLIMSSGLSQLAVTFVLQSNKSVVTGYDILPLVPQPLSNITKAVQSYVGIAGSNAYLFGSVGSSVVQAQRFDATQRLMCSLAQWTVGVLLSSFIVFLLLFVIIVEGRNQAVLVPLTVSSVAALVDSSFIEEVKLY